MQVHQRVEAENYAIVGGIAPPRAFKIGQSAAAFRILSDTLYSDKKLAVVREILCNAVDAHIAAGKKEIPVEVTLTANELRVQDFGLGIADDRMVDIYATYFGSNKIKDDTQTGGFGLGSKAPFAYTEHFSVISCHEGLKTVYALHIDDELNEGAPAVRAMGATKTDESGLTVAIPLAADEDYGIFDKLVKRIVKQGGMNVKLNGELLAAWSLDAVRKEGWGLISTNSYQAEVQVLYANVLYPLPASTGLEKLDKLQRLMPPNIAPILYAPPSSITVTPSRESLSLDTKSLKVVNRLIKKAIGTIESYAQWALKQKAEEFLRESTLEELPRLQRSYSANFGARSFTDPVAGAKETALLLAAHRLTHSGRSDRFNNALNKIAYRKFGVPRLFGDYGTKAGTVERDAMVRLARRLGASDRLFYRPDYGKFLTRYRGQKVHIGNPSWKIYLCASHRDANDDMEEGWYLILPKLKPSDVVEVVMQAKRLKLEVEYLTPVEPKPRVVKPKKPAPQLPTFGGAQRVHAERAGEVFMLKKLAVDPKAYIYMPEYRPQDSNFRHGKMHSGWDEKLPRLVSAVYEDVAVAMSPADLAIVEKRKLPKLGDLLMAEAKKRVEKPGPNEPLYMLMAYSLDNGWWQKNVYRSDDMKIANKLIAWSRRAAHLAWGLPYRKNTKADRDYAFWMLATHYLSAYSPNGFDHPLAMAHFEQSILFKKLLKDNVKWKGTPYEDYPTMIQHITVLSSWIEPHWIKEGKMRNKGEALLSIIEHALKTPDIFTPRKEVDDE